MVVAIMSIISVAGLEIATQFVGNRAYDATQAQLTQLDTALTQFYKTYGRLPCPAQVGLRPLHPSMNYGKEDCDNTGWTGTGAAIMGGAIPFRTLNLMQSVSIDSYGNKIGYYVTKNLTNFDEADRASTATGAIEVRSGTLTNFTTVTTEAAYILVSHGPDKRGAYSKLGVQQARCAEGGDVRIDAQNCVYSVSTGNGPTSPVINANVFYDSRFNNGAVNANYFDDIVIWHSRGQL